MYKEIVGITKNYIETRIDELQKCYEILVNLDLQYAGQTILMSIEELKNVKKTMLNACDYGEWLKTHED